MNTTPNAAWYAEGFRWIGSIFAGTIAGTPVNHSSNGHRAEYLDPEEFLFDVRHRIQSRF
jgi:hypothetical protein